ncbi:CPA1 family monovalent cation:H+ antiporter [Capronia epimyces CBS 606.96]|uniref:CPA1 family monovalent cation:H+ antiporter n=1 Tax=Capronia epimyces CBS 606.96 TaxID=1182542 RepID=W9Y457_9EURO|nr:CPA1 family monovalent cation:H+ antiporter [Capronia epimyces CBS 606.96]EXJ84410.1 CPA1 family monovalent cation:H+ antiporter [Capronia epimyces CBS 606.96]
MAWDHLSINKPHLVYIILGGFTSIFMLCSLFIKEKLYIGEASVATLCGVIFGPHAANLINPLTWGNTDQITLEFSRIVLVVQCFAVGVELPKAYMERHWKSVVFLLVPVMTFGWLVTSLFIWWMIVPLTWLESLVVAACVTATDPVLASSVVGKGKFAKRVPKHLRDLLSAESGCNDGMAFPFIYLSLYLLRYNLGARDVVFHWVVISILYECIFGAFYGVMVGYIGRHAIKFAERRGLIDRESFLVFYFVLALFCAGSGSMLGMDDLLIGFAAGVGFSNDGWFTEKTEESHVSNVIDLLINLAYFVYFGTIVPWEQYNSPEHGLVPWRLVIISLFVIFFRRIPAMLALKPFIPDVKTWREALFAGHFGPIGVGAIFVAILARAELETDSTEPLAKLPAPGSKDYNLIYLVWPVVTFLVVSSILVHGSSIAVFTLGKRINTLTITLSYTQDNEKGPAWMNRLPRISSQSRSMARMDSSELEADDKLDIPPGELPPVGIPKLRLRRQREDEYEKRPGSRSSSLGRPKRRKRQSRELQDRPGGPISQSAIAPARLSEHGVSHPGSTSDTLFEKSGEPSPESPQDQLVTGSPTSSPERYQLEAEHEAEAVESMGRQKREREPSSETPAEVEVYDEGEDIVVEDEEGNVVDTIDATNMTPAEKADAIEKARNRLARDESGQFTKHKHESHALNEGEELEHHLEEALGQPQKSIRQKFDQWKGFGRRKDEKDDRVIAGPSKRAEPKRGPAHAYQFGNSIIVEDEDGEVIKTYTIPSDANTGDKNREQQLREGLRRMSTWVGLGRQADGGGTSNPEAALEEMKEGSGQPGERKSSLKRRGSQGSQASLDDGLRMIISSSNQYGLTGLQKKARDAPGAIALGSGRRLSTKDFIKQMQQLDAKGKIQEVDESDAPEAVRRELHQAVKIKKEMERDGSTTSDERPGRPRAETKTGASSNDARLDTGRKIQKEDPDDDEDYFSPSRRTLPERRTTAEQSQNSEVESEDDEDDDDGDDEDRSEVPTHDVASIVARHSQGQTAADFRRRQLARIRSAEEEEDTTEGETAAEKRRRLAALGLGDGGEESSSDSDEGEEQPRRAAEDAVPEPSQGGPSTQQRTRIQWGGESGREKDPYDIYAGDPIVGAARKLKRMMKKRHETG